MRAMKDHRSPQAHPLIELERSNDPRMQQESPISSGEGAELEHGARPPLASGSGAGHGLVLVKFLRGR